MYLSAEAILDADDLGAEDVPVPEWGGTVRVRGLSGTERDKFEESFVDPKSGAAKSLENYRAKLAAACLVNAEGKKMFRSDGEVKRLGEKNAAALQRVCDVAMRLSGLTKSDQDELVKN